MRVSFMFWRLCHKFWILGRLFWRVTYSGSIYFDYIFCKEITSAQIENAILKQIPHKCNNFWPLRALFLFLFSLQLFCYKYHQHATTKKNGLMTSKWQTFGWKKSLVVVVVSFVFKEFLISRMGDCLSSGRKTPKRPRNSGPTVVLAITRFISPRSPQ